MSAARRGDRGVSFAMPGSSAMRPREGRLPPSSPAEERPPWKVEEYQHRSRRAPRFLIRDREDTGHRILARLTRGASRTVARALLALDLVLGTLERRVDARLG